MGKGQDRQSKGGIARRFALHTAGLFAAMAAPFFLFDIGTAPPVAFGVGFLYVLWWLVALYLRDRGKPKRPAKVSLLLNVYGLSVPFAVGGLIFALIVEWVLWAYLPITSPARVWDGGMVALIVIAATLIFPPILFLLFAPLLARKDGGAASRFLKGVRARGFGWFHDDWLRYTALSAGLFCLLSIASAPVLHDLEAWRDSDGIVTNWELMAAYPFLAFALLAAAAILTLSRIVAADWEEGDAVIRAYIDGAPNGPLPHARAKFGLRALAAGACVAALFLHIYPLHLLTTAKGFWDGQTALYGMAEAVAILRNTHEDDDWTNAEWVSELNRFGTWTPGAPEAGLGSLVANAGEAFPDSCTVRIAAGIIDPPARDPDSPSAAMEAEPELKFCVAVTCAAPFTWNAPSALTLVTSHDSQAEGWREQWYADIQANGVASAPGGYCTATGELTDSYQG